MQVTIANSPRFGHFISVQDAAIDDGRLDLYAVEIGSGADLFSAAGAIVAGCRHATGGLHSFRSAAFDGTTRRRHHVTAEGEPAGRTPARFESLSLSAALRVFVP